MTRIAQAIVLISIFALTLAATPSTCSIPDNAKHALYLLTLGTLDSYVREPCTTDGLAAAVQQDDDASENKDYISLETHQEGYARGFARCALDDANLNETPVFAAAAAHASIQTIIGMMGMEGGTITVQDKARAEHTIIVVKWVLSDPCASGDTKSAASDDLPALNYLFKHSH